MSTTKNSLRKYAFQTTRRHYTGCPSTYNPAYGDDLTKYTPSATSSVTYGDNYKDWKQRIANSQSATTSLTGTRYGRMICGAGQVVHRNSCGYTNIVFGNYYGPEARWPTVNTSVSTIADQKAKSKFLSHYINATNTWRGGNFLAEIRETIHMLRHPVKSFYHSTWEFAGTVKGLGKIQRKSKADYAKHLADAWLAYGFGVKPLISDANDAAAALNKLRTGTGHDTKNISGFGRDTSISKVDTAKAPWGTTPASYQRYDAVTKSDLTVRYLGAMAAHLEDTTTTLEQFGVGVFDIVPAVWEAIPWSFFIDYFANVGEMIDSMRLWASDFKWCQRTVRNSTTLNYLNLRVVGLPSGESLSISGDRFYSLVQYVNRSVSPIPYPDFHFQMPGIDSMKWLNIAALSQQIRSSKP